MKKLLKVEPTVRVPLKKGSGKCRDEHVYRIVLLERMFALERNLSWTRHDEGKWTVLRTCVLGKTLIMTH